MTEIQRTNVRSASFAQEEASMSVQEEASITKIQAHVRGSRVRRSSFMKDLVVKLTPSKMSLGMGAVSMASETSGLSALTASALARPVKAATAISGELRADMGEVRGKVTKALENHLEFPFLASDTHRQRRRECQRAVSETGGDCVATGWAPQPACDQLDRTEASAAERQR